MLPCLASLCLDLPALANPLLGSLSMVDFVACCTLHMYAQVLRRIVESLWVLCMPAVSICLVISYEHQGLEDRHGANLSRQGRGTVALVRWWTEGRAVYFLQ